MVREVEPLVFLIGMTVPRYLGMLDYLKSVDEFDRHEQGAVEWLERRVRERGGTDKLTAADLIEFEGRLCYRSWAPGMNANVTQVRESQDDYLSNVLRVKHGSVIEHASFNFVVRHGSRVFTHEVVRHRAGTAFSQESLRFVRLTDIPFWFPEWARRDEELHERGLRLLHEMEEFQTWMTDHFQLDATKSCPRTDCENGRLHHHLPNDRKIDAGECPICKGKGEVSAVPFAEKKHKTSFMRRFAPEGLATDIGVTANFRELRHIISMRTDPGAEEEIRPISHAFWMWAVKFARPLFQDFVEQEDGSLVTENWKV